MAWCLLQQDSSNLQIDLGLILGRGRAADGNVPGSGADSGIAPGHGGAREAVLVFETPGQTPPAPLPWGSLSTVSHQEIVTGQFLS